MQSRTCVSHLCHSRALAQGPVPTLPSLAMANSGCSSTGGCVQKVPRSSRRRLWLWALLRHVRSLSLYAAQAGSAHGAPTKAGCLLYETPTGKGRLGFEVPEAEERTEKKASLFSTDDSLPCLLRGARSCWNIRGVLWKRRLGHTGTLSSWIPAVQASVQIKHKTTQTHKTGLVCASAEAQL